MPWKPSSQRDRCSPSHCHVEASYRADKSKGLRADNHTRLQIYALKRPRVYKSMRRHAYTSKKKLQLNSHTCASLRADQTTRLQVHTLKRLHVYTSTRRHAYTSTSPRADTPTHLQVYAPPRLHAFILLIVWFTTTFAIRFVLFFCSPASYLTDVSLPNRHPANNIAS